MNQINILIFMEKACIKFIYLFFIYFEKKVKFLYGLMYRNTLYSYLKDRLNVCDDLAM